MDQVRTSLTKETAITDLVQQRCDFAKQLEAGDVMVQPGIDFIDNMLAQWVPGYVPPKGCSCGCKDK